MRWNVQSLADCFIYGYWTLLLCQILNLLGAIDFFIKTVLLNCYSLQFAMTVPIAIFAFALCVCMILQKQASHLWEESMFLVMLFKWHS